MLRRTAGENVIEAEKGCLFSNPLILKKMYHVESIGKSKGLSMKLIGSARGK